MKAVVRDIYQPDLDAAARKPVQHSQVTARADPSLMAIVSGHSLAGAVGGHASPMVVRL